MEDMKMTTNTLSHKYTKSVNVYTLKMVRERTEKYEFEASSISSPAVARDIINTVVELNTAAVEKFGIICLNVKNHIVGIHIISVGLLSSSLVHPREVFKSAMLNNAASIVLFHNHPSGDPEPSREDLDTTKRLVEAGELMGIKILDHVIVGENRYISFKEQGLL